VSALCKLRSKTIRVFAEGLIRPPSRKMHRTPLLLPFTSPKKVTSLNLSRPCGDHLETTITQRLRASGFHSFLIIPLLSHILSAGLRLRHLRTIMATRPRRSGGCMNSIAIHCSIMLTVTTKLRSFMKKRCDVDNSHTTIAAIEQRTAPRRQRLMNEARRATKPSRHPVER